MAEERVMAEETDAVTYEELAALEDEFEELDSEIMVRQYEIVAPAYVKRQAIISKIPNFWPLVLEQAPPEIDQYISPEDSRIFAESLLNVEIARFEIELDAQSTPGRTIRVGNPRSLSIKLKFGENAFFEDRVLVKKFWYRRASDGWTGLVSEPVQIHWKKGKDLTKGLTDMALALWEARRKADDMMKKDLPEYEKLKKKVENWNGLNTSFFTWFGWVSGRRWVSAEESEKAVNEQRQKKANKNRGEKLEAEEFEQKDEEDKDENREDQEEEAGEDRNDQEVEVHQEGDALAISFAEELWPAAIKYFTQAQEMDDPEMSELDFENDDDEEDADGEPVDIPSLIEGKGHKHSYSRNGDAPPQKRAKT